MAALSITVANVKKLAGSSTTSGIAGETITRGQAVYLSSTGKLLKADATYEYSANAVGIALDDAGDNQPLVYQTSGPMNIGATTVKAELYVLDDAAGGIIAFSDASAPSTPDYKTILGIAEDVNGTFHVHIDFCDVAMT